MAAMIDTNVLAFAANGTALERGSKTKEKQLARDGRDMSPYYEASARLLGRIATVKICAVTIVEFRRSSEAPHVEWFDSILPRLRVVQIDSKVAMKASDLLRHRSSTVDKVCRKCLSSLTDHVCGKCDLRVSSYRRINDAMIVAAAEGDPDTEVLYTFDTHISSFQPQLNQCRIRSPFDLAETDSLPADSAEPQADGREDPKVTMPSKASKPAKKSAEDLDRERGQSSLFGLFSKSPTNHR